MPVINLTQQGDGPALVLLHGWGFDSTIWSSILPKITPYYTVYCVDIPEFNVWDTFKKNLLAALPPTFACVGWSMGGLLATRLSLEHPERILHLINITSSPCFVSDATWPGIPAANLDAFYNDLDHAPHATRDAFIALQLPKHNTYQPHTSHTITGLKQGLNILKNWDFREVLHEIKPPVHYFFGRLDTIVPARTMAVMQSMYPHCSYHLFRKAAHAPFLSHPDEFIAVLRLYLENT